MRAEAIHRLLLTALAALVVGAVVPSPAAAVFGPIELVSKSPREQATYATEPALSGDGRYVVFCAEFGGRDGIYREELATGQLAAVVIGAIEQSICTSERPIASAPSISADGRYVSFTTTVALSEKDTDSAPDVYVADMSTSPPTYELASVDAAGEPMAEGSLAAGRVALSADGQRVAFVNRGNVYVRDLARRETILISATREAITGEMIQAKPAAGGGAYEPAGAAISADGSTVAWVGEHLPEQVPLAEGEEAAIRAIEGQPQKYHEPLWRRVPTDAAPAALTRRLGGGAQGPFPGATEQKRFEPNELASGDGWGVKLPQLDADGDSVAFVGNPDEQYDLFVVAMGEGPDPSELVHQVTQWTNPIPQNGSFTVFTDPQYWPFSGEVSDCAISPDGTRVAFTTTRQRFSTAPYALITELPTTYTQLAELYELDLGSDKIERVTPGPGKNVSTAEARSGAGAAKGATSPSFGAGDRLVAFASEAENLVDGDANEKSDVFTVESDPPAPLGKSTISTRPPRTVVAPTWRMTVNAFSRPDGTVRVMARVPGGGTLRATARAQLGTKLATRRVAAGRRRSKAASLVPIELKLGHGRQSLARKPGLVTRVHVSFTGQGGRPLHDDLESRFLVHAKRKRHGGHGKGAGA